MRGGLQVPATAGIAGQNSSRKYPLRCEVRGEVRGEVHAAAGVPRPQTQRYSVLGQAAAWLTHHAVLSTGGTGEYVTAATAQPGMSLRGRSGSPWNLR